MNLSCLGVSFRTASLAERERVACSPASAGELLRSLRAALPATEIVVLSTCNRTELYLVAAEVLSSRGGLGACEAERLARRCFGPLIHDHVRRLREVVAGEPAA